MMDGRRIKALRKRLGMTQTEFARLVMVSYATENRWENGRNSPLPDRVARLRELESKTRRKDVSVQRRAGRGD